MNHQEPLVLSTMMGTYKKTAPLKEGTVTSPVARLDFAPVDTAQKAFKDVVRNAKYDVAELAIMTFLQAFDGGSPYVLLPFVMNGNFHHRSLLRRADDSIQPGDLAGKRVAMRAYSQTTPAWVRGILADEYGIRLEDMLLAGEVDAIIAGAALQNPDRIQPMIAEPAKAALAWQARTGIVPINHVVTIREDIAKSRPDVVRAVFGMLREARTVAGEDAQAGVLDLQPSGFTALRPALEMAIRLAHEQGLISNTPPVDELYVSVAAALAGEENAR